MIEMLSRSANNVLGFRMSQKLHDADYKILVPKVDALLTTNDRVRLLGVFHDFHGWDLHALWDDCWFGISHYQQLDRIAMVGEKPWQRWMMAIGKWFTIAEVKYFEISELESAWQWIEETTRGNV